MKSNALVAILNMPDSTIRKYAQDYAEFLSPTASAGGGRHRDYTDHDARVLKLVIDMKAAKQHADNIDATLRSLQDSGWERLPALDEDALAIIPAPAAMIAAQTERAVLKREIEILNGLLDKANSDRDELQRRVARAEMRLEMVLSGELKPKA